MALTVHQVNDPEKNLLIDQQWEVSDPILSCSNLGNLPVFLLSNPEEIIVKFYVYELGLLLYIVPQLYHFPELVVWCAEHYANDSKSIVTKQFSQIFITISRENIIKMLGLHIVGFPEKNVITLSEEILVQKFTSATPQIQLDFVQGIQRLKYITSVLEFPIKVDTCHTTIQQILLMYSQVFGLYHDQSFSESFLGFLIYLS